MLTMFQKPRDKKDKAVSAPLLQTSLGSRQESKISEPSNSSSPFVSFPTNVSGIIAAYLLFETPPTLPDHITLPNFPADRRGLDILPPPTGQRKLNTRKAVASCNADEDCLICCFPVYLMWCCCAFIVDSVKDKKEEKNEHLYQEIFSPDSTPTFNP